MVVFVFASDGGGGGGGGEELVATCLARGHSRTLISTLTHLAPARLLT